MAISLVLQLLRFRYKYNSKKTMEIYKVIGEFSINSKSFRLQKVLILKKELSILYLNPVEINF